MPARVVILGAGFGGLELCSRLSSELAEEVEVTLIDRNDAFVFGFSKLDVMFGRRTMDQVRVPGTSRNPTWCSARRKCCPSMPNTSG